MGMTFDTSQFQARARKLASRHPGRVRAALGDVAIICENEARDRAPFQEGLLTNSITGEYQEAEGKKAAVVKVPENSPASDYAIPMHENNYNLGPGSVGRQARTGKTVGGKYITRAIDESRSEIMEAIKHNLRL